MPRHRLRRGARRLAPGGLALDPRTGGLVWAFSESARREILPRARPRAIAVVPPAVDTGWFRPAGPPAARERLVVSTCAAISPLTIAQKGLDRLVAAPRPWCPTSRSSSPAARRGRSAPVRAFVAGAAGQRHVRRPRVAARRCARSTPAPPSSPSSPGTKGSASPPPRPRRWGAPLVTTRAAGRSTRSSAARGADRVAVDAPPAAVAAVLRDGARCPAAGVALGRDRSAVWCGRARRPPGTRG